MTTWSRYGSGAFQYRGFRTNVIALLRTQLFSMNAPAPTGLVANCSGLFMIAVGDPMYPMYTTELGKAPLRVLRVILKVVASTTSSVDGGRYKARGDLVAGSASRCQLNLM